MSPIEYLRRETDQARHRYLFWRVNPHMAVRHGRWKLWKVNRSNLGMDAVTDIQARWLPRKA